LAQTIETLENMPRGEDGKLSAYGQAERWALEFNAAKEKLKPWHTQAEKILDRYLDERAASDAGESRLNLFTANIETQHSMLYGQVPKCSASRRFADSQDDVARVAGEMLERICNTDIERDGASYASAIGHSLEDRLLPGFGFATVRYEVETEQVPETPAITEPCPMCGGKGLVEQPSLMADAISATDCEHCQGTGTHELAPAVPATERKSWENVETDYHYWRDVLWSPARTFEQWRWGAWKAPLTRDALIKRFGHSKDKENPGVGDLVPLNTKTGDKGNADAVKADPFARADVWEIWSKPSNEEDGIGRVYWYVEGFDRVLDMKDDPLQLADFFPFPAPMIARPTTRSYVPRPDFVIAQDLYNEIDTLSTRINLLEKAIRVAGIYDKTSPEVAKLLTDAGFNKLYPADNMAAFVEKGGMKGAVDWFPLEQVVAAVGILTEKRAEKIGLLQQVTGWSDIMRGQSNPNETLGAQKLKTRFGGVRVERFQKEFAGFASGLLQKKAEIISKHYDVETIIERSNVLNTPDAQHAQAAAQLIKDKIAEYRVEVKPEAISLTDFAQMKEERVEVVGALAQLFTAMAPLVQQGGPPAAKFCLKIGKWVLAGTKGSSEMEGEFDRFVDEVEQMAQQPKPPDPALMAKQAESKAKVQGAQMDMQVKKLETEAHVIKAQTDMRKAAFEASLPPRPMNGPPTQG
jgi:hypothetical protein